MAKHSGFALLEILISVVLVSILLLGINALQLSTLRKAQHIYFTSLANLQILNMREILFATKSLDGAQLEAWNTNNLRLLPRGNGEVTGSYPNYIIKVRWGNGQKECDKISNGKDGCISCEVIV